jgi:hypothetical protein
MSDPDTKTLDFEALRPVVNRIDSWKEAFRPCHALDRLPDRRLRVSWSVSAGDDGRPLVYFSEPWLRKIRREWRLSEIEAPEMHIFTGLSSRGHCGLDGMPQYTFEDRSTRMFTTRFEPLELETLRFPFRVERQYYHFAGDFVVPPTRAALIDVQVESRTTGVSFTSNLLYLEVENINAFDVLFSTGLFDVRYLIATREGLGMGGCGKSVLEHIYADGRIRYARMNGFEPQYVVTWEDYTHAMFTKAACEFYPDVRSVAPYIGERQGPGAIPTRHHLNQLWETR